MANMLRKNSFTMMFCQCNRHHKPTCPWSKRERRRARAREKLKVQRDIQDER